MIYISLLQFVGFAIASPTGRKSIVRSLKRPRKNFVPPYGPFKGTALNFIRSGGSHSTAVFDRIADLKSRKGREGNMTNWSVSALALEHTIQSASLFKDWGLTVARLNPERGKNLMLKGLQISMNPNAELLGSRMGRPLAGALRIYPHKNPTTRIGKRGAEIMAALLYLWLVDTSNGSPMPDSGCCLVFEVFDQRLTPAPLEIDPMLRFLKITADELERLWNEDQEAA